MSLRICLLTDQDLDSPDFPKDDWRCDPRPFLPEASWSYVTLRKESAVRQVIAAAREGFDLFFNLCDGAWDEGRVGIEVVQALEWLDVPFTGADSAFYEPSREAMKRVCRAWEIDTPAYATVRNRDDLARALDLLRFPLFVKHPNGYASSGLTRDSRVETPAALRTQVDLMIQAHGAALVEEYVDGPECTVLVAENPDRAGAPVTYRPLQYAFPEGEAFKHEHLKWVSYHGMHAFPVEDPELDHRLREASARFFQGMRGAGFGRCDIRLDREGRPFMLEINPNCGVYYPPADPGSADLILMADPAGHEGFTRTLVEAAFARHRRRRRGWEILPGPGGDYGTYATRDFAPGERVVAFEGGPHHLVTLGRVEATWGAREMDWFRRYAWPLSDEVWVTWSPDPEEWRPVNHSCDPTGWLDGLDVTARLPIAAGQEITLDYATFYDERMPAFECRCRADRCRGTIRGSDYRLPFMVEYGDHVSPHIRRRIAGSG